MVVLAVGCLFFDGFLPVRAHVDGGGLWLVGLLCSLISCGGVII